jgi:hypothetical protein
MRAFTSNEMILLYKFTKTATIVGGMVLVGYGIWWLLQPLLFHLSVDPLWLFGIFPVYVGSMCILIAIAMKEDWFTNARRYW